MDSLNSIVPKLQAYEGSWAEIAKYGEVSRWTVARIATGQTPNPGAMTLEKVSRGIREFERKGRA